MPTTDMVLRESRVLRLGAAGAGGEAPLVVEALVAGDSPHLPEPLKAVHGVAAYVGVEREGRVLRLGHAQMKGIPLDRLLHGFERRAQSRRSLALRAAKALAPLHNAGIAYGLFSPAYLLMDKEGVICFPEPYTASLALACAPSGSVMARLSHFSHLLPPWAIPPEWLKGAAQVTPASDVFQCAAWLAAECTGAPPFGSGLSVEVVNRMLAGNLAELNRLGATACPAWLPVLSRGLAVDPGQRWASVGQMLDALPGAQAEAAAQVRIPEEEYSYSPYSAWFDPLPAQGSKWGEQADLERSQAEGRALVEQLQRLRPSKAASSGRHAGETSWRWWLVGAVVLLVAAGLFWLFPELGLGSRTNSGSSAVAPGAGTHSLSPGAKAGNDLSAPTEVRLVRSIPDRVTRHLATLGIRLEGELAFEPPVLPPYRVRVRPLSGSDVVLEFASRSALSRVALSNKAEPGMPASYTVLYDALGEAKALMPYDSQGRPLPVSTLPEAAIVPPRL